MGGKYKKITYDESIDCMWYATEWYAFMEAKDAGEVIEIGNCCDNIANAYDLLQIDNKHRFEITGIDRKLNGLEVLSLLVVCADILMDYQISERHKLFPDWLPAARQASKTIL